MFYNQKLQVANSDIDLAHQIEDKFVDEVSNVRSKLVAERQNHLDQTIFMEKALELSANKSEEFRRALVVQRFVIENLSSN